MNINKFAFESALIPCVFRFTERTKHGAYNRRKGRLRILDSKYLCNVRSLINDNPYEYQKDTINLITYDFESNEDIIFNGDKNNSRIGAFAFFNIKNGEFFYHDLIEEFPELLSDINRWILLYWKTSIYFKWIEKNFEKKFDAYKKIVSNILIEEVLSSIKMHFSEGHRFKPGGDDSYWINEERSISKNIFTDDYIKIF